MPNRKPSPQLRLPKSKSTAAAINTITPYLSDFAEVFQYGRERITIPGWMQAWRIAESPVAPRSYPLIELYDMVLVDAEVMTAINNRKNKVLGEPFLILDAAGEYDEVATKSLKGSWFDDFTNAVLDAEFFGSSLIEFGQELAPDYTLKEVNVVERRNVIPSHKLVLPYPFSAYNEGIDFTAEHYQRWYIFVRSKRYPLGLLLYAAPYAILSRDALIRHADFNRDYGRPYKIVKTDKEGEERQQVLDALLNVEEELNGVFDTDEDIEIAFPAGASGSIDTYDRMDEKVSKKLLKIIQGHIKLSNDTEGGGLQTYQNKDSISKTPSEEIKEYDMARVEGIVNEELLPRLLDFNYPFQRSHSFIYLDTYLQELQRQKKRISEKALELALQHFQVEAKEFEQITGIKVKKKVLAQTSPQATVINPPNVTRETETGATIKEREGEKEETKASDKDQNQKEQEQEVTTEIENQLVEIDLKLEQTQNRDFFDYGAITLPIANQTLWAELLPPIDPDDLYINPKEGIYGYEDNPHVTILYGIHAGQVSTEQVTKAIKGSKRDEITIWLGQVSCFENELKNYEVLKFEVVSPDLIQFYFHLKTTLPHTKLHPKYAPHATIAFLKKGCAAKYLHTQKRRLTKVVLTDAQYSDGKGNKIMVKV